MIPTVRQCTEIQFLCARSSPNGTVSHHTYTVLAKFPQRPQSARVIGDVKLRLLGICRANVVVVHTIAQNIRTNGSRGIPRDRNRNWRPSKDAQIPRRIGNGS